MLTIHRLLFPLLLLLAACRPAGEERGPAPQLFEAAGRARVVDGDTLEIAGLHHRLFGIDALERRQSCARNDGALWPCGKAAAEALRNRIAARPVLCRWEGADRYGRPLSRCSLAEGGLELNAWMVRSGWALAYRQYSLRYVTEEAEAAKARRGLWSGDFTAPWDWRRKQGRRAPTTLFEQGRASKLLTRSSSPEVSARFQDCYLPLRFAPGCTSGPQA